MEGSIEKTIYNDIIENSEQGNQASYITSTEGNLESNPQIEELITQKNIEKEAHNDFFMP